MIVGDWLWVAGRREDGADWTYAPISSAAGSLIAPANSPIKVLTDLSHTRLGVVGRWTRNWLILQAYGKQAFGMDLDQVVKKTLAPPPVLLEMLRDGQLDSVVAFWQFAAKAEARGMPNVLSVEEALRQLGVPGKAPFTGYVFSRRWAGDNRALIDGFLAADARARALLASSDGEWLRLKPPAEHR